VQYGRVGGARVVTIADVQLLQVGDDRASEGRVGDPVEVLVDEIRHASTATEELDQRDTVDGAGELATAALEDPQHR
jgi:hypothetical protein